MRTVSIHLIRFIIFVTLGYFIGKSISVNKFINKIEHKYKSGTVVMGASVFIMEDGRLRQIILYPTTARKDIK